MIRSGSPRVLSQLLAIVSAVVVIAVLYLAKTVVLPLALAILLSFILAPVVSSLERIHLPRMVAVLIVIGGSGAILGIVGWTVFNQLVQITNDLPAYTMNIQKRLDLLHQSKSTSISRAQEELDWLGQQMGIVSSDAAKEEPFLDPAGPGSSPDRPVSVREVGASHGRLDALSGVAGVLVSTLLVVVFAFFMLLKREDLRNRLIRLGGHGRLNLMTQAMGDTGRRVSRYL